MLEQSNFDLKVSLGPKNLVPEITLDNEHLKKSVNTSDFVPRIEVLDSDNVQVTGETQNKIRSGPASLYNYMQNSSQLLCKKKPGRPKKRKFQVEPLNFLDEETNDSQKFFMQDNEPISGKRYHGKVVCGPSKWNDYTVENFDETITSSSKTRLGKFSDSEMDLSGDSNFDAGLNAPDDDDSLDDTPHRANKNLLPKLPRPVVIPLSGEAPQNRFPSSKNREQPQTFEPQHHIIVQNFSSNSFASTPGSAKPEFRQRILTVTPIFNTNTLLSSSVQSQSESAIKTLVTAGGEKILVSEAGDENSIPVDDNTGSGNSGFDGSINFREFIQDPIFSPFKKSTPRKQFSFNSDLFHRMPSTRGRGGVHNLKGRPSKEDQLSHLTNGEILGTALSETRKSSIASTKINEEHEVKKNRVFVVMQDGTVVGVSGSDRQKAVLKATAKVEAIRRSVGRIREIEKAKYMHDDDDDYDDPKEPGARYAYALRKHDDTWPALEDCTLDTLDDYNGMILPNSVQLVESDLPLSEAENYEKLQGVYLFRQIFSSYDNTLQCLFCHNKYSMLFPEDLEMHYHVIHELAVNISKAQFNEDVVFVCVPSDVKEDTTHNSGCSFCDVTLKTFAEVCDHYPSAHNKTIRLIPQSDVTDIGNFFYCGLCSHACTDFPSHHQHMKLIHRMQTYVCRYCTYCTSRSSRLRSHVKERHLQDQPSPHLQCSVCSKYVHGEARLMKHIMSSHAVQTGPETWSCAKCLYPYGDHYELITHVSTCPKLQSSSEANSNETAAHSQANPFYKSNSVLTSSSEEEIKLRKHDDTWPALEDCTLDTLDDYNGMILPNSVQLVESDLPLSEAENYEKLQGVYLFRQIFSSYDNTLQCLFCRNKYSMLFPEDLEMHYHVIHDVAVNISKAQFNEDVVFVCVPSDVKEDTTLNSGCSFCDATLKTFAEVRDHYPSAHNKTIRLIPVSDVNEIGNFFYCGLCSHASADFPSHHQHMKVMHGMQTYVCLYCTYCTSKPNRLRTHVKERHLQDQPGPHLQCCVCSVYVHGEDRLTKHMLSHAVQTGPKTLSCAKCLHPYEDTHDLIRHISVCPNLQSSSEAKSSVLTSLSEEEIKSNFESQCQEEELAKLRQRLSSTEAELELKNKKQESLLKRLASTENKLKDKEAQLKVIKEPFDALPNEVILKIFKHLMHNELLKISRVCKRWNNLSWCTVLWQKVRVYFTKFDNNMISHLINTLPCNPISLIILFRRNKCNFIEPLDFKNLCTELSQKASNLQELVLLFPKMNNCKPSIVDLCIKFLPKVTGLSVCFPMCLDYPAKVLCRRLSNISSLDLTGYDMENFYKRIFLRMPDLKKLCLKCSNVSDNWFNDDFQFLHKLEVLNMGGTSIGSSAFRIIKICGSSLKELYLCGVQLGFYDLIVDSSTFPQLNILCLRSCSNVTQEGIISLIDSCPSLKTIYVNDDVAFSYNIIAKPGKLGIVKTIAKCIDHEKKVLN